MTASKDSSADGRLRFGPFILDRGQRLLMHGDEVVRVGGRALDILIALLERPGQVIAKRELIARAWPSIRVEDANLRVQLTALRRILGRDPSGAICISNVAGEGYIFSGVVTGVPCAAPESALLPPPTAHLPIPLSRIIGRASAASALVRQLATRRFVNIVGAGGVGKTTLALAIAAHSAEHYRDGVFFLDLSTVSDPFAVSACLAAALRIAISPVNPLPDFIAYIELKRILIVIDNCEHLGRCVTALAEGLLSHAPNLKILATSREPTRATGEYVYRLAPLAFPGNKRAETVVGARSFPAIQLFVERATDSDQAFRLNEANVHLVSDICRQLDGIPLALELAAARAGLLGVPGLAAALEANASLSIRGRRTASARHRTLGAAIAWSYELLSRSEQTVLRRLSVLKSRFTLESAAALAAFHELDAETVIACVHRLAERSLISTDFGEPIAHYRLLNTTRTFAFERLADSADYSFSFRWYALYLLRALEHAEVDSDRLARADWTEVYCPLVGDLRAALDWAFSLEGDVALGVQLTLAAIPFGFGFGSLNELQGRVEQSLTYLARDLEPDTSIIARLRTALAVLLANTHWATTVNNAGSSPVDTSAEETLPAKRRLQPLIMHVIADIETGNYDAALALAHKLDFVAAQCDDPTATLLAGRVLSQARHFAGHHKAAREQAHFILSDPGKWVPLSYLSMTIDRRVSLRIIIARCLWMEGFADQAAAMADECIRFAEGDSQLAQCQALALAACPIALWRGDFVRAGNLAEQLMSIAARFRLSRWHSYGPWYIAAGRQLSMSRTETVASIPLDLLPGLQADTLTTIAPDLVMHTGSSREVLGDLAWCAPERRRAQAERLLEHDPLDAHGQGEAQLHRSLKIAGEHGALAWELRAATSLAILWQRQGHVSRAQALIAGTFNRMTEGYGTNDATRAKRVIDALEEECQGTAPGVETFDLQDPLAQ